MEKNSVQQRLEIARHIFPAGTKVCNSRIGSVGYVDGSPFFDVISQRVFLPVKYIESSCFEDVEFLIPVNLVKKGHRKSDS